MYHEEKAQQKKRHEGKFGGKETATKKALVGKKGTFFRRSRKKLGHRKKNETWNRRVLCKEKTNGETPLRKAVLGEGSQHLSHTTRKKRGKNMRGGCS